MYAVMNKKTPPKLLKHRSSPEFIVQCVSTISNNKQVPVGVRTRCSTSVYHGSKSSEERKSNMISDSEMLQKEFHSSVQSVGHESKGDDRKKNTNNYVKYSLQDIQTACTGEIADVGSESRLSTCSAPLGSNTVSACDKAEIGRALTRITDRTPKSATDLNGTGLSESVSLPTCKQFLSQYIQRVMSLPSIDKKLSSSESLPRQHNNGLKKPATSACQLVHSQNSLSRSRSSNSQFGLTPDTIPDFIIPTLNKSFVVPRNTKKTTVPGSNEFVCKALNKPGSQSFSATVSATRNEAAISSKTTDCQKLFDPGLSLGMTLKHIEMKSSSYGFPMLSEPASWATDESIFHRSSNSRRRSNTTSTGYLDRTRDTRRRGSSDRGNMLLRRKSLPDAGTQTLCHSMSAPSPMQLNHLKLRRSSSPALPSLPEAATQTLCHSLSTPCPRQLSRLKLRRTSSPALHMNLVRSAPVTTTSEKSMANKIQLNIRSPYVYSCNKSIVIAKVEQPIIDFSGTVNASTKTVDVTLHSVYLPGIDIEPLETRVIVWMGKHDQKCHFKRQKTNWMPQSITNRYLFGAEMSFGFHHDINLYWLNFKIVTRRAENKDVCRRAGKVLVSVGARGEAFCHITRILEDTYKHPQLLTSICFKHLERRLVVTIVKIGGMLSDFKSCFNKSMHVDIQVFTKTDKTYDASVTLQRETTSRKYRSKGVVFKEAVSFDLPQPSWEIMRKRTSIRFTIHVDDYLLQERKLGHVEVGLGVKDTRAAKHWDEVTRFPNKPISQSHAIYDL